MDKTGRDGETEGLTRFLGSVPRKRSVTVAGHMTSVSLEGPFWDALERQAKREGTPLFALISRVDRARTTNLSSALRLYVLYRLEELEQQKTRNI